MKSAKTLTLIEVAAIVGVCRRTLYTMIDERRFPVKPIKGTKPRRWNPDHVEAWKGRQ